MKSDNQENQVVDCVLLHFHFSTPKSMRSHNDTHRRSSNVGCRGSGGDCIGRCGRDKFGTAEKHSRTPYRVPQNNALMMCFPVLSEWAQVCPAGRPWRPATPAIPKCCRDRTPKGSPKGLPPLLSHACTHGVLPGGGEAGLHQRNDVRCCEGLSGGGGGIPSFSRCRRVRISGTCWILFRGRARPVFRNAIFRILRNIPAILRNIPEYSGKYSGKYSRTMYTQLRLQIAFMYSG